MTTSCKYLRLSPLTKHLGLQLHWFRSKVSSLEIDFQASSSTDQLADQFTKGLFQTSLKVQESSLCDGECKETICLIDKQTNFRSFPE